MSLFKKKPKQEFIKTEPTQEMIKAQELDPDVSGLQEEEFEEPEQLVEEVEEDEEVVLNKKLEEVRKRKEEDKKKQIEEQSKIMVRERAVPVEFMFNNLSDRIEGIEMYIAQLDSFLKSKFK